MVYQFTSPSSQCMANVANPNNKDWKPSDFTVSYKAGETGLKCTKRVYIQEQSFGGLCISNTSYSVINIHYEYTQGTPEKHDVKTRLRVSDSQVGLVDDNNNWYNTSRIGKVVKGSDRLAVCSGPADCNKNFLYRYSDDDNSAATTYLILTNAN